jgi:predicted RNase H-like HicB family nuclease
MSYQPTDYAIKIIVDDSGPSKIYIAKCLEIVSGVAYASTPEEALRLVYVAIGQHLAHLKKVGRHLPEPNFMQLEMATFWD